MLMEDRSHKRLPGSMIGLSGSIMSYIKVQCEGQCKKKLKLAKELPYARLESSYCAPKNFGAHFKTSVRECKKIGAQSA